MPIQHQSMPWVSLDLYSANDDDDGSLQRGPIMMNTQQSKFSAGSFSGAARALAAGQVMTLGTSGGRVQVLSGRIWLTSPGDLDDHVLDAGDSFCVDASGPTLVEAWDRGEPALIAWRSRTVFERIRSLVKPAIGTAVLHNAAPETRESLADGSDTRDRSRRAAQEARRRTPGFA
jgi:hypothetical protein